ncbi:multidrug effflux MFS transporter [Corynebacterium tapiri]|uniref:Multidrug effflux MFS transporter n=1 Tax=Corynebacterium tapiri TaxID=1448266 RepID=A0A5C4U3W9_9CORY|nr:multidrug effflux MFS transporter [Corynebacterium tapiri]
MALLSASAPFSIDMYLPALPMIAAELGTTEPMVQLTLSGFVLGLAVGQLVIGPISDALGRKKLLIIGAVVAFGAAALAASAPSVGVLIFARVVQGLGSGACMVVARAVIPDLASGTHAAKAFATMMSIQTLAPVIAPLVGGVLVGPLGWRGLFWALAVLALVQLLASVLVIPESRPAHLRSRVSLAGVLANYAFVLGNRAYRGYLLTVVCGFATLFSYISASAFVFQNQLGFSPQAYAVLFGVNSLGILGGNIVNSRLIGRFDPRRIMRAATCIYVCAALSLLGAVVVFGASVRWLIPVLLFAIISQQGLIQANSMSLGQLQVRSHAGGAAALMGFFQFAGAAVVGPLVGLGSNALLSMALSMSIFSVLALVAAWRATAIDRA